MPLGGIKTGVTVALPANALKTSDLGDLDGCVVWSAGYSSTKLLQKRDHPMAACSPREAACRFLESPLPGDRLPPRDSHGCPHEEGQLCPWLPPAVDGPPRAATLLVS